MTISISKKRIAIVLLVVGIGTAVVVKLQADADEVNRVSQIQTERELRRMLAPGGSLSSSAPLTQAEKDAKAADEISRAASSATGYNYSNTAR